MDTGLPFGSVVERHPFRRQLDEFDIGESAQQCFQIGWLYVVVISPDVQNLFESGEKLHRFHFVGGRGPVAVEEVPSDDQRVYRRIDVQLHGQFVERLV